jgi:hypothetical protein
MIGRFGQKVFMSDLSFDQAMYATEHGCLFMSWATGLPTSGRFLRAALSEYSTGVTTLWFEWVEEEDETVLGGVEELTVCTTETCVINDTHGNLYSSRLINPD